MAAPQERHPAADPLGPLFQLDQLRALCELMPVLTCIVFLVINIYNSVTYKFFLPDAAYKFWIGEVLDQAFDREGLPDRGPAGALVPLDDLKPLAAVSGPEPLLKGGLRFGRWSGYHWTGFWISQIPQRSPNSQRFWFLRGVLGSPGAPFAFEAQELPIMVARAAAVGKHPASACCDVAQICMEVTSLAACSCNPGGKMNRELTRCCMAISLLLYRLTPNEIFKRQW